MKEPVFYKLLGSIVNAHRKKIGAGLVQSGLTRGQPMILDVLSHFDGCSQKFLAEKCQLEPATITSVLSLMEKADLVQRNALEEDKRVMTVHLTSKGKDAYYKIQKVLLDEQEHHCFAGFSNEEKMQALNLLQRINRNLTGHDLEF